MFTPAQTPYLLLISLIPSVQRAAVTSQLWKALFKQGHGKQEEGGFWVIYSGGSRLNQGMTTVWLTYFTSAPRFGIFWGGFCTFFSDGLFSFSVNETERETCGLLLKLEKCFLCGREAEITMSTTAYNSLLKKKKEFRKWKICRLK